MNGSLTLVGQAEPTDPAGIHRMPARDGVTALLAEARHEVISMSTLSTAGGPLRHHTPRPGLRYRAVFPDTARSAPSLCGWLGKLSLAGLDIRTMPQVPMDVLVIDGSVAILPADTSANSVVVLRLPGVVTTATELFERVWPDAVPLAAADLPGGAGLTVREQEMLRLLALGATDEVAAAQLGISVRTVRRMVAQIMHRLGARSRFQAGVKAADRGWLLDRAS